MYGGLMFASLITIVTFLFTFTRFYNHKRLANQNIKLFALTKEVEQKNERLKDQHDQILQINERLEGYNQHLEERVLERTEELEIKNKKLTEYAFINSHLLRGPLSRILGLVHLLNLTELTDREKELISHLNTAGDELDEVISKINKAIDSGHTFDRETIIKLKK
jgi:signal transduction histidine kinase